MPLQLTVPVWIGLALVALLGVVSRLRIQDQASTLDTVQPFKPVIVRHQGSTHRFMQLGIEIPLPDGWVYLSLVDEAVSTHATLMHAESNSIVSFRPNRLETWPPKGHDTEREIYSGIEAEWVSLKLPRAIRVDEQSFVRDGLLDARLQWTDFDPRQLARITPRGVVPGGSEESRPELIMIVVTHQLAGHRPDALAQLCDAIRFLGVDAPNIAGVHEFNVPVRTLRELALRTD